MTTTNQILTDHDPILDRGLAKQEPKNALNHLKARAFVQHKCWQRQSKAKISQTELAKRVGTHETTYQS